MENIYTVSIIATLVFSCIALVLLIKTILDEKRRRSNIIEPKIDKNISIEGVKLKCIEATNIDADINCIYCEAPWKVCHKIHCRAWDRKDGKHIRLIKMDN